MLSLGVKMLFFIHVVMCPVSCFFNGVFIFLIFKAFPETIVPYGGVMHHTSIIQILQNVLSAFTQVMFYSDGPFFVIFHKISLLGKNWSYYIQCFIPFVFFFHLGNFVSRLYFRYTVMKSKDGRIPYGPIRMSPFYIFPYVFALSMAVITAFCLKSNNASDELLQFSFWDNYEMNIEEVVYQLVIMSSSPSFEHVQPRKQFFCVSGLICGVITCALVLIATFWIRCFVIYRKAAKNRVVSQTVINFQDQLFFSLTSELIFYMAFVYIPTFSVLGLPLINVSVPRVGPALAVAYGLPPALSSIACMFLIKPSRKFIIEFCGLDIRSSIVGQLPSLP